MQCGLLWGAVNGVYDKFGVFWWFIRVGDACKVGYFTCARFFVHALGIAFFTYVEGGVDEYFDEVFVFHEFAHAVAVNAIGAYKAGQGDDASVGKEFADFADAADVFSAVFG